MNDYTIDPARTRAALHDLTALASSGARLARDVRERIDAGLASLSKFDDRHGETMDALRAHVDHLAGETPEPLRVATSPDVYGTERGTPVVTARGVKVGEVEGVTAEGRAVLRIDDPDVAAAIRADHGSFKVRSVETVDTVPVTARLKVYPGERPARSSMSELAQRMVEAASIPAWMPGTVRLAVARAEQEARDFDSAMQRVERATRDMRRGPVDERAPRPSGSAEDPACFTSRSADDLPSFEPGIARAKAAAENPPAGFTLCPDCRGAGVHFPCSTCEGSALVPIDHVTADPVEPVDVWCGATLDVTLDSRSVRVECGHLADHAEDHRGPIEPGRPGDVTWPNLETPGVEFKGDGWTAEERRAFACDVPVEVVQHVTHLGGAQYRADLQSVLDLAARDPKRTVDDEHAILRLQGLVGRAPAPVTA